MSANPFSLWVYLSQSPLLWLTVTLLVYATTDALSLVTHRHPLANPVLHSICGDLHCDFLSCHHGDSRK